MDAQTKSIVSSIVLMLATSAATWLASHGLIPSGDVASIANDIVFCVFALGSLALLWYKKQQHTPAAQIAAVNAADNGVKVVAASVPAAIVNAPLK